MADGNDGLDLKGVRLLRLMEQSGGKRWRGMYNDGETKWLTLYEKDRRLLLYCGVEPHSFIGDFLFKLEDQPAVKIVYDRGIIRLHSVEREGNFVTQEDLTTKAIDKTNPTAIQKELTYEFVNATIDKMFKQALAKRVAEREANGIIITPEQESLERAEVYGDIINYTDAAMDNMGKTQLQALWRYQQSGDFRRLPEEPQDVRAALGSLQLNQRDYILSLSAVVVRIFTEVQAMIDAETPFMFKEKEIPITVEMLIMTKGLIRKLTKSSEKFSQAIDRDMKEFILNVVLTESADRAKALIEGKSTVTNPGLVLIPIKIEPIVGTDRSILTLEVNEVQREAAMRVLKPLIQDIKQ